MFYLLHVASRLLSSSVFVRRPHWCIYFQILYNTMDFCEWKINLKYEQKQSPRGVLKKDVLENLTKFTEKRLFRSNFIKKETLAQVFACEFC